MLTAEQEASDLRALVGLDGWRHLVRHFGPQVTLEGIEPALEAARLTGDIEPLRLRLASRHAIRMVLEWPTRRLRELGA